VIPDVVIVGAGVSGLACARELADAGARAVLVERSRGVGGRCATRRCRRQPVDHGVAFLHGSDPDFVAAIRSAGEGAVIDGWPSRVVGSGLPCQPDVFRYGEPRVAYTMGATTFPKQLAQGLEIRLGTRVVDLDANPAGTVTVRLEGGEALEAPVAVVALAGEQVIELTGALAARRSEVDSVRALLGMTSAVPCLVVIAGYEGAAATPPWQVLYPGDSAILHLVSHDSDKRERPARLVLVLQARPAWSQRHRDEPPAGWERAMLAEAGRLLGAWAASPSWTDTHRWSHARLGGEGGWSGPILLGLGGGGRLGFAGEAFSPRGGVEGAWISGRRLARRVLEEG
jgi:hypothetical protein